MKKRTIALLLAIVMLFAMIPVVAQAESEEEEPSQGNDNTVASGTCGDNLTWTLDDQGILSIFGSGAMEDYSRDTMPWYEHRSSIKSVEIPDGVTSIGTYAFGWCDGLTSITIPDGVTSIGDHAFVRCESLTSITIPDGVTSIGDHAFIFCTSLTSVTIPDGVTSIGDSTFYGCQNLTSVTIPSSVTSIGNLAFDGCSALTEITIPDSVTSIGNQAFDFCRNLTSITFGENSQLTSIGSRAFNESNALTSITIPDGVTSIGAQAFDGGGLTSVTIPSSVTSIGSRAFYECDLTSVTIYGEVTEEQLANIRTQLQNANVPEEIYADTTGTNLILISTDVSDPVEPDANILGMNGYFADYFVLNLYVQTDVENPTFVIKRNVTGTEETLEEMTTKSDFANKNIATYTVDKLAAGTKNKIGLTNVSGKECYMVSIKFFTRYLNDDIVLSMKNGDTVMNISSVVLPGMDDTTIGIGDAVPEQSYSFIDYVSAYAKAMGESSPYYKLYTGLKLAAEGAKALG